MPAFIRLWPLAVVLLVLASAGCGEQGPEAESQPTQVAKPDWVVRVYPPPGSEGTAAATVQVRHDLPGAKGRLRLKIDGVDVTSYADVRPGQLTYDPERAPGVVELTPGRHTARVERVSLPREGATYRVLDFYQWRFTLL
ncbi:MAG: hypothetical protein M3N17_01220 [Actinomycetota bacterium]|nr:hypothetical protein [Actinomycetota bacterium]